MKTRFTKIDKNPKCINCGDEAEYNLERNGFLYSYDINLCWKCLKQHINKLKVFLNRDKLIKEENRSGGKDE